MSRLYNILDSIVSKITPSNQFACVEHTIESNVTINANALHEKHNATISKSGYYPIGIIGHKFDWVSGTSAAMTPVVLDLYNRTSGSGQVSVCVGNGANATGKINIVLFVLWAKNVS